MTIKDITIIAVGVVVAVAAIALTATQPNEQAAANCASGTVVTYEDGTTVCKQ